MATETRVDYFLPTHCGEARGCVRNSEMAAHAPQHNYAGPHTTSLADPQVQFYPRDDKRNNQNLSETRAQYHSWTGPHYPHPPPPTHHHHPLSYSHSNAETQPHTFYGMHPPPPMRIHHMSSYPPGHPAMVTPHLPHPSGTMYSTPNALGGQPTPRGGHSGRNEFATDSSSSNCTPRDHYGVISEKNKQKKSGKKNGTPKIPVVKIPETLKKQGQPSPAQWLNARGFPLRPGKPDCKHYISKGWCAYGTLCKFNHPDSASLPLPIMSTYGPPPPPTTLTAPMPHGMNSTWVEMPHPPTTSYGQWAPWTPPPSTSTSPQQQCYPMTHGGACFHSYPCSCSNNSPTASSSSTQANSASSKGADVEN